MVGGVGKAGRGGRSNRGMGCWRRESAHANTLGVGMLPISTCPPGADAILKRGRRLSPGLARTGRCALAQVINQHASSPRKLGALLVLPLIAGACCTAAPGERRRLPSWAHHESALWMGIVGCRQIDCGRCRGPPCACRISTAASCSARFCALATRPQIRRLRPFTHSAAHTPSHRCTCPIGRRSSR